MDNDDIKGVLAVISLICLALGILVMTFAICSFSPGGCLGGTFLGAMAWFLWRASGREVFPNVKL